MSGISDYQVIVRKPPDYNIIVSQKQGPQGDVTPEAIAAKEAAEEAAANAKESEINAKESELNAKESEINAAESAESAAQDAALVYSYVNAPAYDPDKVYNYNNPDGIPDVVVCDDGYAYRCIGDNIQGEYPPTSPNWVRIPEVKGDLFVMVEHEGGYGITQSLTPGKKESDFFEKTPNGSITFKRIIVGETEDQRDFYPRQTRKSNLGLSDNRWKRVYAEEGNYDKLYSSLYNGYVPEDKANKGRAGGYASLDENGKIPLEQMDEALALKADLGGSAFTGSIQAVGASSYFYFAATAARDTVNDIRIRNNSGVLTFERCTVANANKGGGTWAATGTNFMKIN